jgi:hypothetical protein
LHGQGFGFDDLGCSENHAYAMLINVVKTAILHSLLLASESREGAVIQVLDAAQPPERKSKPKKALIAVIATLATGFALLLFVFVRQALANARRDQESAEKLSRLKSAFGRAIGRG